MKKAVAAVLSLVMIFSLAACSEQPEKKPAPAGKTSEELYEGFLAGTETVQGAMPGAWNEYNMETETYRPFLTDDEALTIEALIKKTNQFYELNGSDACVDAVEYAYIDCGNDGEPELAVRVKYPDSSVGGWNIYVIKNIEGELMLCHHAQGYYRYTEDMFNVYGMFENSGSSGAGSMVYGQGFVDADGQYHCLYNSEYFWEMGWCWSFDEAIITASQELEMDIPEDASITLTSLKDYEEFENDEYYDPNSYMITLDSESEESYADAKQIAEHAGLTVMEQSEVDKILEDRKQEFGLTEEMYNDHDYVEWIPLENDAVHDICAYGPDPVFCSTVDEFVSAIDDGAVIVLAPGEYDLTEWLIENGQDGSIPSWEYADGNPNPKGVVCTGEYFDEFEGGFIINKISDMKIVAEDPENAPLIVSRPRLEDVIAFEECYDITLEGLVLGHTPDQGSCSGAVIGLNDCSEMTFNKCDLYGCGTYGVEASDSYGINVKNSVIHDCSYGCVYLVNCGSSQFENTVFENCTGYTMFSAYGTYSMAFDGCTFRNLGTDLLYVDENSSAFFYENNVFDADALNGFRNHGGVGAVNFY